MATDSRPPKKQESTLSLLNTAIEAMGNVGGTSSIRPVKAVFFSTRDILTAVKDSMVKEADYVELGLTCADVCGALNRGTNGRRVDQLTQPVLRAIEQLTTVVAEIQGHFVKRGKRNQISQRLHKKKDIEATARWRFNLNRILHILVTELETDTQTKDPAIHHDAKNTHPTDSGSDSSSSNTDVHQGTSNTHPIASNVHPSTLKTRGCGQNLAASASSTITTTGKLLTTAQTHASAPRDSLPPQPRNASGTVPTIHHDRVKTAISEVHHDFMNTQAMVRNMLKIQEGTRGQDRLVRSRSAALTNRESSVSAPGELPPPPPRIFFGRDDLIERIVGFAEQLTPIALIGAGGIGKTSVALTALHDDRIKRRFGDNRRFIRCDKFPASLAHFLRRLSKTIGSSVENPDDLTPLRPFLSSRDMFIVLDNAESILDPHVLNAEEIYGVVEELSQLGNVCVCITSRISTFPPDFEWLDIPTLSEEAACDTFYRIHKHGERSDLIGTILTQLDFHALSITLLATVAHHNKWDTARLAGEWEERRTDMLQTDHNRSLAAAIELSLSSLIFQELGPYARGLLGIVAFFPQGVNENKIDWLFPTIAARKNIFDKFCVLSLAYRSDGFVTMLAPIRDYLSPRDPMTAPLLCSTKDLYFSRLSVHVEPGKPGYEEAKWIKSEDVNVEHLLDVFTTTDATSRDVWGACANFIKHLSWHKPRHIILDPKIEALADDHPSKPECLYQLSRLFQTVGKNAERRRLLSRALELSRQGEENHQLARILRHLSRAYTDMSSYEEGIRLMREACEVSERLGDTAEHAWCLADLAWLLHHTGQLDAAGEAATHAIGLMPEKDEEYGVCQCHRTLGAIYGSMGDTARAIHHFEEAIRITSSFNWLNLLFWVRFSLSVVLSAQGRFSDAYAQIEQAKVDAVSNHDMYLLARAMKQQARFWRERCKFEEARSEALLAIEAFEKLGAAGDVEATKMILWQIEWDAQFSGEPDGDGSDQ